MAKKKQPDRVHVPGDRRGFQAAAFDGAAARIVYLELLEDK
jgi:hypothetical protein